MADSKDKNNENSSKHMPDDTKSSDKQDEFIDDDDVIDSLLMDDDFSDDGQSKPTTKDNSPNKMQKEQDSDANDFDVDDLIDSVSMDAEIEEDEFADEDEFNVDDLLDTIASDPEDSIIEEAVSDKKTDGLIDVEPENKEENSTPEYEKDDDAFLMADFDISADDDDELLELPKDKEETAVSIEEQAEPESTKEETASIDLQNKLDEQSTIAEQTKEALTQVKATIIELTSKVSQLETENSGLKELITTLTSTTSEKDKATIEEINTLHKDQRKLKKSLLESGTKTPVITYVVMAIAILALMVGGGLGAIGYGAQTDVENLTELVSTLEEEIEIITAKDVSTEFNKIKTKIETLNRQDQGINNQLAEISKKNQQPDTLKITVDDLVMQNDHAQKAIEQLLASVEKLELKKAASVTKKRVKKVTPKPEWAVNLISFKQEWYAKRKAKEFEKKGIPAKVERVKINGKKWFRLRVNGFKSKYEAAAYAVKVKKTLNLSSVWLTKP